MERAAYKRINYEFRQKTGISIMKITPKLDAGPVMMKSKIKISKDDNYESISKELSNLGAKMIVESLELIEKKLNL